jgi:hypothetical protein
MCCVYIFYAIFAQKYSYVMCAEGLHFLGTKIACFQY